MRSLRLGLPIPRFSMALFFRRSFFGLSFFVLLCLGPSLVAETVDGPSACVPTATELCLNNGLRTSVDWEAAPMAFQPAGVASISADIGYFVFDDRRYPEVVVWVLDACAINNSYWVFSTGLSDRRYDLNITDTGSGALQTYANAAGSFSTFTDTTAFACTAGPFRSVADMAVAESYWRGAAEVPPVEVPAVEVPVAEVPVAEVSVAEVPAAPGSGTVGTLINSRFEVRVTWQDFAGNTGDGHPVNLTDHANYFWFFSSSNPEIFVKIVDNSEVKGFFSVIASGWSSVAYDILITDTCSGVSRAYSNPQGNLGHFSDSTAFSAKGCVFQDRFESGGLTFWSP